METTMTAKVKSRPVARVTQADSVRVMHELASRGGRARACKLPAARRSKIALVGAANRRAAKAVSSAADLPVESAAS